MEVVLENTLVLIHEKKISAMKDLLPLLELVAGGGVALLRASTVLLALDLEGDERVGAAIVTRAIEEPLRWIATNAGHEGAVVVQRVKAMTGNEGFNAQTDHYEDLVQAGVIDPAKVVRSALQNAGSIAGLLLTTEAVISRLPEDSASEPMSDGDM
jgi:chaperonin GroEL